MLTRRHILGLLGGCLLSRGAGRRTWAQASARLVVVGGGFAGATGAKYLRLADSTLEVTLLAPQQTFTTCPFSNAVLAGINNLMARVLPWCVLCLGLVCAPAVVRPDGLVSYQVIDGAIPEPLTAQPGDPEHGRRLVLDREAGDCTICHAMPLPQREFHGTVGPPLDGIGQRASAGVLRLRLVDPRMLQPSSIMPAYYTVTGLHRVLDRYRGRPLLNAQQIEDIIAYLLTLRHE